jgi:hypothetical protein
MVVVALEKDWEIKECSYRERRELQKLNTKTFWGKEQDPNDVYTLLDRVEEMSGISEEELSKLSMSDVDTLLYAILSEYLGISNLE